MDPADRKKREPPDPEGGGPMHKKHALSSSATSVHDENVDPKDAPVLLYQNKAMQIRLKEIKMEMQSQEETIRQFTEKQRLYDETLSCAHRTWDQLNDSAQKLVARLNFNYDGIKKGDTPGTTLTHLLFQTLEPLHDITEYDSALQKRVNSTQQIVSHLVEAVEKERANNERITALLRDQAPAAIQEKIQQLENENKNLTSSLNQMQQAQQQIQSSQTHTENQNRSYLKQIEELQGRFYQFETELTNTRRKVIKQEIPLPVGVIAQSRLPSTNLSSSSSSITSTTSTSTNGAEAHGVKKEEEVNNNNNTTNGESSQELSDVQVLAEKRLEELGKIQEEKISILKENTRLRDELNHLSADRVAASEPFKRLERETKALRENFEREKDSANRFRNEANQLREIRKKDKEILESAESNKRRVIENQLRELQELVTKLRLENHEIQGQVEKRMASLPYIAELKLLVASRDTDIKKMRDECDRILAINKQLNERKGDKVEETLHAKLVEVSDLQDKIRKLERDLDDFTRKEKNWIARERDYRSLLDSYQSSSKDRRDLHDLRVAERRLRDEVEDLRHERDDIRRAYEKTTVRDLEKKFAEDLKTAKADYEKGLAKANYDVKELKKQLDSKTEEYEMMIGEVDNISKAYDDMQAQNKRLMTELGSKEDITMQVASEGIKIKRQLEMSRIEARDALERYTRAEEICKNQKTMIEELEFQVGQGQIRLTKTFEEYQAMIQGSDTMRRDAQMANQQAFEFKQQVESLERISAEARRKTEDLIADLEREKEKVRRMDEDKTSLKRKLDRANPAKGGFNIAEEELKGLKQKLTCSVCNDRMKDTVISKCFHVFCHECVATNLQIRKRRCPQCQAPFSNNDVHTLFGFV